MPHLCQQCHATVSEAANLSACPACGGALVDQPGPELDLGLDPADALPRQVDRRGILLPRRHFAGGIITPR